MTQTQSSPWSKELNQLVRGASGGMLFGIPLLYTMEVWWIGSASSPKRLLLILLLAFIPVFALTWAGGFRGPDRPGALPALFDSVRSFGLGIVAVGAVLLLIREIDGTTPLLETVGKISLEAIPFCLGAAVAGSVLSRSRDEGDEGKSHPKDRESATIADLGATTIGAVFIAFNIAPTDEVPMLAAAATPVSLIFIVFASLLISYGIVFEAGFAKQEQRKQHIGIFQHPITETFVCYVVALLAAIVMLWFFGNMDLGGPWQPSLEKVLLLGLPATIGGAAGRLAV